MFLGNSEKTTDIQSFGVFRITFNNLVAKYVKNKLIIDCLVSTERRLCQKMDLFNFNRGSYDTTTFINCGLLPGISK